MELLPDYGNLMTLEDFISNCGYGGFIDYDGFGEYATSTHTSNIRVIPSDIKAGKINREFTHVVWFNR